MSASIRKGEVFSELSNKKIELSLTEHVKNQLFFLEKFGKLPGACREVVILYHERSGFHNFQIVCPAFLVSFLFNPEHFESFRKVYFR